MSKSEKEMIAELYADCSTEDLNTIGMAYKVSPEMREMFFRANGEYGSDYAVYKWYWSFQNHAEPTKTDAINPDHYKIGGIETIDYMKAKSTKDEFHGYLRLNAMKYLSRVGHKDDSLQEYEKAMWYLDRLIDELKNES